MPDFALVVARSAFKLAARSAFILPLLPVPAEPPDDQVDAQAEPLPLQPPAGGGGGGGCATVCCAAACFVAASVSNVGVVGAGNVGVVGTGSGGGASFLATGTSVTHGTAGADMWLTPGHCNGSCCAADPDADADADAAADADADAAAAALAFSARRCCISSMSSSSVMSSAGLAMAADIAQTYCCCGLQSAPTKAEETKMLQEIASSNHKTCELS